MSSSWWPLAGLRLRTPGLELRWPSLADLDALAGLADAGVHDPAVQPFSVEWTDVPGPERARSVLQWHWSAWAGWKTVDWRLELAVVSRKLGYSGDGIERHVIRGQPATIRRLRLTRAGWQAARSVPVQIDGLETSRAFFGMAAG